MPSTPPPRFMPAMSFMPASLDLSTLSGRAKFFFPEIVGTTISSAGAVTAWQQQAQWVVSMAAGIGGAIAAFLTIRSLLKKERAAAKQ